MRRNVSGGATPGAWATNHSVTLPATMPVGASVPSVAAWSLGAASVTVGTLVASALGGRVGSLAQ